MDSDKGTFADAKVLPGKLWVEPKANWLARAKYVFEDSKLVLNLPKWQADAGPSPVSRTLVRQFGLVG